MEKMGTFTFRLTEDERLTLLRLRGHFETQSGERMSLGDVLRRGIIAMDEHTKKNPAHLGDTQG